MIAQVLSIGFKVGHTVAVKPLLTGEVFVGSVNLVTSSAFLEETIIVVTIIADGSESEHK